MLPQIPHSFEFIHFKDRKDLPHLLFVVLLVVGIGIGVYLALQPQLFNKKAAEGGLVDLKFEPENIQISQGTIYEAKIAIDPKGQRVTAAQLYLGYDPASVSIQDVRNEGFLPITLKSEDDFKGTVEITYGSTIETQAIQPGVIATIKFKALGRSPAQILVKGNSQVAVSSLEGNVLTNYPILKLEVGATAVESAKPGASDLVYPNNLLLEKPVLPDPSPFIRDFEEAIEPKPEYKPERVEPELSEAYLKQLGRDIFIEPIVALNEVIEDKATEILKPEK